MSGLHSRAHLLDIVVNIPGKLAQYPHAPLIQALFFKLAGRQN
jgi:hypothetical protein